MNPPEVRVGRRRIMLSVQCASDKVKKKLKRRSISRRPLLLEPVEILLVTPEIHTILTITQPIVRHIVSQPTRLVCGMQDR